MKVFSSTSLDALVLCCRRYLARGACDGCKMREMLIVKFLDDLSWTRSASLGTSCTSSNMKVPVTHLMWPLLNLEGNF